MTILLRLPLALLYAAALLVAGTIKTTAYAGDLAWTYLLHGPDAAQRRAATW